MDEATARHFVTAYTEYVRETMTVVTLVQFEQTEAWASVRHLLDAWGVSTYGAGWQARLAAAEGAEASELVAAMQGHLQQTGSYWEAR